MTSLDDPGVQRLLTQSNHAVVATLDEDGSVHTAVVWVDLLDGRVAVNSEVGRKWPTDLERDPRITVMVYDETNPYECVEVRGTVTATLDGADEHVDRLAAKYLDVETYPWRQPGKQRVTYLVEPTRVRYQAAWWDGRSPDRRTRQPELA